MSSAGNFCTEKCLEIKRELKFLKQSKKERLPEICIIPERHRKDVAEAARPVDCASLRGSRASVSTNTVHSSGHVDHPDSYSSLEVESLEDEEIDQRASDTKTMKEVLTVDNVRIRRAGKGLQQQE